MTCRISDLRYKEVVNVRDGCCLGCVNDIEVDTVTARVCSLIIYGKCRLLGLFLRDDDIIINWCDIEVIGEDTILVNMNWERSARKPRQGLFGRIFG